MQLIKKYDLLAEDGVVIFEHLKDKQFEYQGFELIDKKRYGIKEVSYFRCSND